MQCLVLFTLIGHRRKFFNALYTHTHTHTTKDARKTCRRARMMLMLPVRFIYLRLICFSTFILLVVWRLLCFICSCVDAFISCWFLRFIAPRRQREDLIRDLKYMCNTRHARVSCTRILQPGALELYE